MAEMRVQQQKIWTEMSLVPPLWKKMTNVETDSHNFVRAQNIRSETREKFKSMSPGFEPRTGQT